MAIDLTEWQGQVFLSPARFKVLRCGRRAGKTYLALTTILKTAAENPGEYWFISPTYRQSKEIAWKLLNKLIPAGAISKTNETELLVELINKAIIKLKGADNPDSLRGVGLDGVVLDEFAFMKASVWEEIVRPMLLDRHGWAIFISTPKGYNHFYQLWEDVPKLTNYERFHFTSYDNPYLPKDELENIKATTSDVKFQQEYLAEFTKFEGAIWPMFSRDHHLKPKRKFDRELQHVCSIDFGFAIGHPTAFGIFEFDNQGNEFLIDGFMESGLTIEKIDEKMRQLTTGLTITAVYYDTARPDLAEELKQRGWPMLPAIKDVEVGLSKVGEHMSINPLTNQPRLTISEHLSEGIRQIENYEWQEVRDEAGKFRQVPHKEDDDFPDMIRYCLATHGQDFSKPLVQIGTQPGLGGIDIPLYG